MERQKRYDQRSNHLYQLNNNNTQLEYFNKYILHIQQAQTLQLTGGVVGADEVKGHELGVLLLERHLHQLCESTCEYFFMRERVCTCLE